MSIIQIQKPLVNPLTINDYQRQNDLIFKLFNTINKLNEIGSSFIKQGSILNVGGLLYKADSNTTITGTTSKYVKITQSGDKLTCTASYVANLTGVSWNNTYNGYYDASLNLYIFSESEAIAAGQLSAPNSLIGVEIEKLRTRIAVFTSSGNFVVPSNVKRIYIHGTAAGGNGGAGIPDAVGGSGNCWFGGGGGAGEWVKNFSIDVTPGETIAIGIGAVGANTTIGAYKTLSCGSNGQAGGYSPSGAGGAGWPAGESSGQYWLQYYTGLGGRGANGGNGGQYVKTYTSPYYLGGQSVISHGGGGGGGYRYSGQAGGGGGPAIIVIKW